jgi:DNA transformation protein
MPNSPDFVAHVLELMRGSGAPSARAMFGGHGIYLDGMIVGIVVADVLYLKADDETRPRFLEHGLAQFEYETKKGKIEGTGYYQPPEEALEGPAAMREWLRLALGASLRAASRRAAPRRKPSQPRANKTRAR